MLRVILLYPATAVALWLLAIGAGWAATGDLLSVAMVCSSRDPVDTCTRDTALDVIVSPASTPMECLMHAQASAAHAGLPGGDGRYLKISCEHRDR